MVIEIGAQPALGLEVAAAKTIEPIRGAQPLEAFAALLAEGTAEPAATPGEAPHAPVKAEPKRSRPAPTELLALAAAPWIDLRVELAARPIDEAPPPAAPVEPKVLPAARPVVPEAPPEVEPKALPRAMAEMFEAVRVAVEVPPEAEPELEAAPPAKTRVDPTPVFELPRAIETKVELTPSAPVEVAPSEAAARVEAVELAPVERPEGGRATVSVGSGVDRVDLVVETHRAQVRLEAIVASPAIGDQLGADTSLLRQSLRQQGLELQSFVLASQPDGRSRRSPDRSPERDQPEREADPPRKLMKLAVIA